jgi:hypothetical protein
MDRKKSKYLSETNAPCGYVIPDPMWNRVKRPENYPKDMQNSLSFHQLIDHTQWTIYSGSNSVRILSCYQF